MLVDKPIIWNFRIDPIDSHYYHTRVIPSYPETGYLDTGFYVQQSYLHAKRYGMGSSEPLVFPPNTPALVFNYPMRDSILPDLLCPSSIWLCSARLRSAMSLPPDVVQYLPIEVRAADPQVHAMCYKAMHVIARQPVIDLDRSDVQIKVKPDLHIGGTYRWVSFSAQHVLHTNLTPQTDLFHATEVQTALFATDALAHRVMVEGCLGVIFTHPEQARFSSEPRTIRTARGIELEGPKARRAHLRRVKRARAQQPESTPG